MKQYYIKFGTGDSSSFSGLTPTFTIFATQGGTSVTAPGISEIITSSGIYGFQYGPTVSIVFKADGGAGLATGDRYVYGALDPIQVVDERLGTTSDSFGSTATDPSTVFGYLKRSLEFSEGDATFTKSTGTWDIYSRGSSTLLREKSLANNTTAATKS